MAEVFGRTAQASQHPEARVLIEQALNSPLSVETSGLPGGHCIELGDGLFGELSQVEHGIGIAKSRYMPWEQARA
jgi:hypothetical protein